MKRGRRTILTKGLAARLCKIIAMPCTIRSACQATGIGEATFFEWLSRGEKGEQPFAEFAEAVTRAKGRGKVKVQRNIWDCDDPRVKLELLSRIYAAEFGRVDVRPLPQPEPEKKITVAFVVDTKGKTLAEVANFPVVSTKEAMARIASGGREPEPAPAQNEDSDSDVNHDELGNDVEGDDSPC